MNIEITTKEQASELRLALVARRSALTAQLRLARNTAPAEAIARHLDAVRLLLAQVDPILMDPPTSDLYLTLEAGEIVRAGDQILTRFAEWAPVKHTVGSIVCKDEVGCFRRPV